MRLSIILLGIVLISIGCSRGKYLPIQHDPIGVAVPLQQEIMAGAVQQAFAKIDPKTLEELKGKPVFVDVIQGYSQSGDYLGALAELTLAKAGAVVLPVSKKQTSGGQVTEFPIGAQYRALLVIDLFGTALRNKYMEFWGFTWDQTTTYQGLCKMTLTIQALGEGTSSTVQLTGESPELLIAGGYIYDLKGGAK